MIVPGRDDAVQQLVAAYRAIDAGMRSLPIHNPRLVVEATGFAPAGPLRVGALLTPWFLNLVVLGGPETPPGVEIDLVLPGGVFTAMGAAPRGIAHLAIHLMSPVHELPDQAGALAIAREALRLALTPASVGIDPPRVSGRRALLTALLGQ